MVTLMCDTFGSKSVILKLAALANLTCDWKKTPGGRFKTKF